MPQSELGSFTEDGSADRPAAEAEAVAGTNGGTGAARIETADHLFPAVDGAVDIGVIQVDYTVEGRGDEEYPVVHIFGRTAADELVHVKVYEFQPYFYAPTDSLTEGKLREYDRIVGWEETDDDGEPYESIRGRRLTKIYGQTPRDVGQIRDEFDHYEADILFPNRLLIDKDLTSGVRVPAREDEDDDSPRRTLRVHHEELTPVDADPTPRVNTFDIEVDDRSGFPEDGEEPIICIASHDSTDDEYILWLYEASDGDSPPERLDDYEPINADGADDPSRSLSYEIRTFDTEDAMLDSFLSYIHETDPDLLTGWNFDDFDAPYLLDRFEVLDGDSDYDLDPDRLSRVDEVWRSGWQGPDIKGRIVFDLLYAYQRTQFTELDSYKLEDVGQLELGVGKERYPGDIGDLWEENPERLLEYNLRDVELCVELDRDQAIIAFWNEVRQFVGCKIEDATTPGDAVDMYVLHKLHDNFALPSKGQQESEEYEGGAVFDPITGVRENVSVLDLKCFSGDTDVLTPEGPKSITEMEVGDPIYTLDPETFECEVKPVAETHQYENTYGELHHLSGNTHDFKITENHQFLICSKRGCDEQQPDDFEFEEYREITDGERFAFPQHQPISGRTPGAFDLSQEVGNGYVVTYYEEDRRSFHNSLPESVTDEFELVHGSSDALNTQKEVGKYLVPIDVFRENRAVIEEHADHLLLKYGRRHRETPLTFAMEDWLELLGWFVTEGSLDQPNGYVTLHQDDSAGREAICDLLDRMEINYNTDQRGINISNQYLVEWLEQHCGDGYTEKHLPSWVFELDSSLLKILLTTMIRGDGSRTDSGLGKFWTKSDQLKDDIVDIAVRCGQKPTVSKQSDGTWYVSIGKRGSFEKSTNATVEEHDGDVYCVTAEDNHVVLAGRNGHYQWVGQSLYPMCMVTINASPETKVDPAEYDGETYRAPNGTRFRKEPDGAIRGMVDELLTEREEKKSLRDEHDPNDPEYDQYDRQQAAVKVIMNCFTPDTEVLTPDGIRGIRDLDVGDDVYSLDPETMQMEVKPVTETHAYPEYEGELVDIETSEIDFSVTPNHRLLVRKNETNGITEDDWSFIEAGNLDRAATYELPHGWDGPDGRALDTVDLTEYIEDVAEQSYIHRESGRKWIPRQYDGDDFLELLAWYITEGDVYTPESKEFGDKPGGSATTVKVTQESLAVADGGDDHHSSIGQLLDRMGIDYSVDDRSYQFTSRLLGEFLEETCGANSHEKQIPEFVYDLSEEQKQAFLETLIDGDGDRQPSSWRYTTSSKQLRDDLLRLCTHLGLTANYSEDSGSWRIDCTGDAKNTLRMHRSGSRSTADDGVYCVTVADNNTLVAGRNGKFQNVSNSLYGVLGWDRFRLYDREMGAAVTATGRDVIEFTEQTVQKQGYEVVYGDTDSVMLEFGQLSTSDVDATVNITEDFRNKYPEKDDAELEALLATVLKGFEIEENINESYNKFAKERLNAGDHRFEIEFEKLYRRFFQAGKKKRYAGSKIWMR